MAGCSSRNVIKPQGLEPLQFPTKFRSHSIHDDWTVFSYDSARETFVLRQFNSEGFVNTFVLQDPSTLPDRMVFVLVASENASGARGSLTYARQRDDTFEEVFELTMPGVDSPITIRNRWRRATP